MHVACLVWYVEYSTRFFFVSCISCRFFLPLSFFSSHNCGFHCFLRDFISFSRDAMRSTRDWSALLSASIFLQL